jgi:hypothetical protein
MTVKRPTHNEIAARAYQIWLEQGRPDGHDLDHWLQAEYELMQLPIEEIAKLKPPVAQSTRASSRKRSVVDVVRAAMML